MKIRRAAIGDSKRIYRVGKSIPELEVVSKKEFMSREDLKSAIRNKRGIFLVAEDLGKLVGFAYAYKDKEAPTYAAFVYVAVIPSHRRRGIGKKFVAMCEKEMKKLGARTIYGLATNVQIIKFMRRFGYRKGKTLYWIEKKF